MTLRFLLPGLAMVVLLAAGAWFVVQRVMSPVISFSRAIDERAPSDSGPVVVDDLPQELQPVGRAVNGLLGRVESALTHERTLTADAAHELRTPLAALRAQAQVALRARDETERRGALQALIGGVDRATRLVESVLTLARLDARSIDPAGLPSVSLQETVAELADELGPAARARRVELQLQLPDLSVRADGDSLRLALRNLCENAIRHANSCVRVGALPAANQVVLSVRDDGPGMSAEQKSRAFDRFYRGTTDGIGAGLGLALVKRVAEQHGGSVRFSEGLSGRGLGVELVLPDAKVSP